MHAKTGQLHWFMALSVRILSVCLPASIYFSLCTDAVLNMCVAVCLQKWGWVQEMYAFAIACYLIGAVRTAMLGRLSYRLVTDHLTALGTMRRSRVA